MRALFILLKSLFILNVNLNLFLQCYVIIVHRFLFVSWHVDGINALKSLLNLTDEYIQIYSDAR